MSKDLTKLFFHDEEKDNVDGELIGGYNKDWDKLEKGIVKVINNEDNEKLKINCLKNIEQAKKEIIKGYTSRFENFYPDNYTRAKGTAFQIENTDNITASLEALTVNCVKQENINNDKINRIESDVKELIKITSNLNNPEVEYLKIEVVKKEPIFDVRNWDL
ncbi:10017_t:CDS:2 [Dentiscutata erythropus]|uniref:10017_t:CDS:1 n=1 Tax=Dentiscutata erythropus TaxID=1348616 RepID=A0A9N9AX76_9GLOM|nr:10017_t:CDS:2 [Dentiscutata erythropus]